MEAEEGASKQQDACTKDGSVDLRGRPAVAARTGRWKACAFLVGYESFERMAFYGVASNLVVYLTTQLREATVPSVRNVNNWTGAVWMTPIAGAYIADTFLGRFWTFTISSLIYLAGMLLITLAVSLKSLHPQCTPDGGCPPATRQQVAFFYGALYTMAIGAGGTKPNISTFGADQFDDFDAREREIKASFFNWWMFSSFTGGLVAVLVLVFVQENVGWGVGYTIPTAGLALSLLLFYVGTPFYRHKPGEAGRQGVPRRVREPEAAAAVRRRRAAGARDRVVRRGREAAVAPHAGAPVPRQGGDEVDGGGGGGHWPAAVHGDRGGGGEADGGYDCGVADDASAVHRVGAGEHPVREAGHHAGPFRRRRAHPGGVPGQLHHRVDAAVHPGVRPRASAAGPAAHGQPTRDHPAPAPGHRVRAPGARRGVRLPRGGPAHARDPGALRPRRRRDGADEHLLDAAAVRADGRGRRVQLRGHPRVLLRPVAGRDAEPGHHLLHQRPRRRQLPQQPARDTRRPGDEGQAGERGQELDRRQSQRLPSRLLLRVPAAPLGAQHGALRVGGHEVQVQEGVPRGGAGEDAGVGDGWRPGEGGGQWQGNGRAIEGQRDGKAAV